MIGVFDSGSGGLTVLSALRRKMPHADFVYFGDILNAPYGEKSPQELSGLIAEGINQVRAMGARDIVCACNTASAGVLQGLAGDSRIIEMTRPLARAVRRLAGKRVLLMATPATVASGSYDDAIAVIVRLTPLSLPGLAGAIERGDMEAAQGLVAQGLETVSSVHCDAIILGCTHYPLIRGMIERQAQKYWSDVEIIDPAEAVAEAAAERFDANGNGEIHFKISQDSDTFRERIKALFPGSGAAIAIS